MPRYTIYGTRRVSDDDTRRYKMPGIRAESADEADLRDALATKVGDEVENFSIDRVEEQ